MPLLKCDLGAMHLGPRVSRHYMWFNQAQLKLCAKKFVRKMMINHFGFHIFHNDCSPDPHCCGYCGEIGCNIDLVVTSGYGRNVKYGPRSDCEYYTDISKRADNKFVKSYPCSNRPVKCEQCETVYWSYNLTAHYSKTHPNIECPTQISSEESGYILNKKQWSIYIYIIIKHDKYI